MTKAMPFLQKYDITFLRPPTITGGHFCAYLRLFDLLLQGIKFRRGEEFAEGDTETVTEFFKGDNSRILAFPV